MFVFFIIAFLFPLIFLLVTWAYCHFCVFTFDQIAMKFATTTIRLNANMNERPIRGLFFARLTSNSDLFKRPKVLYPVWLLVLQADLQTLSVLRSLDVYYDISTESTGRDKPKLPQSQMPCVKSVLINMDLFVEKCLCVHYSGLTASERACGGSMGLLLAIKARFDLCLPLGRASALG